jgi:hypothetical protein
MRLWIVSRIGIGTERAATRTGRSRRGGGLYVTEQIGRFSRLRYIARVTEMGFYSLGWFLAVYNML